MNLIITPADAARAHDLSQEIQQHLIAGEYEFLLAGRGLVKMQDRQEFEHLGFDTFNDYARSDMLPLQLHQAQRLMRVARRTDRLIRKAEQYPEILATVAAEAGLTVGPGTVKALAERAVMDMGIAKADRVLGKVVEAETIALSQEWMDKGRILNETHLDQELARDKRGGAQNPLYDYLVGQRRRGMALCGELPTLDAEEAARRFTTLGEWLRECQEWLVHYWEESRNGVHDRETSPGV